MPDSVAEWLDAVHEGLGAHAHAIEGYGATTVALLGTLDAEDIEAIAGNLRSAEGGPPPLQIKWITKALASEVEKVAKQKTAGAGVPRTPNTATERSSSSDSDDEESRARSSARSSEDEEDNDDDRPARKTGKAPGSAASASTQRPRGRNGAKRNSFGAVAGAAGKAFIPNLFDRSSSKKNRHGMGGQASVASAAAGRARPFGGLALRGKNQCCVNPCGQKADDCTCPADAEYPNHCTGAHACASQLTQLVEGACTAARRTPSEITKFGRTSQYNLARLRIYLIAHAFDSQGSPRVHLACLQAKLLVSYGYNINKHTYYVL